MVQKRRKALLKKVLFLIVIVLAVTFIMTEPETEAEAEVEEKPYVECSLPLEEQEYLRRRARELDLDYYTVLALIWTESEFDSKAISPTDDWGLMQINAINHPRFEEKYGSVNWLSPRENIRVGLDILKECYDAFPSDREALIAYSYGIEGAKELFNEGIYTTPSVEEILIKRNALEEIALKGI